MLNKKIPFIENKLFVITEQINQLSDKYKNFNNFSSVKDANTYLNYLEMDGEFVIVDFNKNILYNEREILEENYYNYCEFFRLSDLKEIFDLFNLHKSVFFIKTDWSCDVLGCCRLICRFGDNVWKSYPINVI
jgi:hypothetical protein